MSICLVKANIILIITIISTDFLVRFSIWSRLIFSHSIYGDLHFMRVIPLVNQNKPSYNPKLIMWSYCSGWIGKSDYIVTCHISIKCVVPTFWFTISATPTTAPTIARSWSLWLTWCHATSSICTGLHKLISCTQNATTCCRVPCPRWWTFPWALSISIRRAFIVSTYYGAKFIIR